MQLNRLDEAMAELDRVLKYTLNSPMVSIIKHGSM